MSNYEIEKNVFLNDKIYKILYDFDKNLDKLPNDNSIPQIKLDLCNRIAKNVFEWRGQFSPELVEAILSKYATKESVILDPFVGSGTTLFECVYQSLTCYGVDINPSAFELSKTIKFANIPLRERSKIVRESEEIFLKNIPKELSWESVNYNNNSNISEEIIESSFIKIIKSSSDKNELLKNFLLNVMMKYYSIKKKNIKNKLFYAFNYHKNIVIRTIPFVNNAVNVYNNDARSIPLNNQSIDLILTSPPYINVFNYHQNYRSIIELYENDLLKIAKSEIGSNRKNRSNRFLSVIQYCLDMKDCLNEMSRLLKNDGIIILIIGEESKIMNVKFNNCKILISLACKCCNLKLINKQKRHFTTRFGKNICENILYFKLDDQNKEILSPIEIGKYYLYNSLNSDEISSKELIINALKQANIIEPSPIFIGQP